MIKAQRMTIGVRSLEQGLRRAVAVAQAAGRGHPPAKTEVGIYFETLDDMRSVLTARRLDLLRLIRQTRPASVYALAASCDRDLKNVREDVGLLAKLGLVRLSRPGARRKRVVPQVDYDRVQIQIPLI